MIRKTTNRKRRTLVLVFAAIAVVSLGVVTYSSVGSFIFARGSDIGLLVARPSFGTTLLVGMVLLVGPALASRVNSVWPFTAAILVSLTLWMLFGRTVGLSVDGRLFAGWFFLRTNTIQLRGDNEDAEAYSARWRVMKLSGWRIQLQSGGRTERLFVGPASLAHSLEMLENESFEILDN